MNPNRKSLLIAFLSFGAAGVASATPFVWNSTGAGWRGMIPAAGVAAAVTGGILWRWLVLSKRVVTRRRALLVGAFIGFAAHPVAWYLLLCAVYFMGVRSSLGERTLSPMDSLWGAFVYSFWSLLFAGWITVPLGGVVGLLLSIVNRVPERQFYTQA